MSDRQSIIAYIEAKAAKCRERAAGDVGGGDASRGTAVILEVLASDIRAMLDVPDQAVAA